MTATPTQTHTANIISLAERLELRLMNTAASCRLPYLYHEMEGLRHSESLHRLFRHLMAVTDAGRTGKASPALAAAALWRIAESIRDQAYEAERLERKLRKAKKRAR